MKCIAVCALALLCGCSSMTPEQREAMKKGTVDACYSVIEFSGPEDKIQQYLASRVQDKLITLEEADMVLRCIRRTTASKCWRPVK